jgi:hypothetical protein
MERPNAKCKTQNAKPEKSRSRVIGHYVAGASRQRAVAGHWPRTDARCASGTKARTGCRSHAARSRSRAGRRARLQRLAGANLFLFESFHRRRLTAQLKLWTGRKILHIVGLPIGTRQRLTADAALATAQRKRRRHAETAEQPTLVGPT